MPKATTAKTTTAKGKTAIVDIYASLDNRDANYRCIECDQPVKPHKAGSDENQHPARFEHYRRNPKCSLSDHRFEPA